MTEATDGTALAERVRELEAENAALAARVGGPGGTPARAGSRWRAFGSALCIVLASILVPISIVTAWARVQLVEEDAFVETLAPLVDDVEVQELIVDQTMAAVRAQVDFRELTDGLFDGIAELGVGPKAATALDLLRQPAADGLESMVGTAVETAVQSEVFSDVWATAVRGAHRALTIASTSDGHGIVVVRGGDLGIAVGPIVEEVKTSLTDRGVAAASLIPAVDRTIIVGDASALVALRTGYAVAAAVGWWLPVITLLLFGLGLALARRRPAALLGAGVGIGLGGASLATALTLGATAVAMVAAEADLSPSALDVIYGQLIDDMRQTGWVFTVIGVVTAVAGWLAGRSEAARGTRSVVGGLNASIRRALVARGVDTGGVGAWLARHRVGVRVGLGVLAVLWLFALRPITGGDLALVVVVALAVGWLLELVQRRPAEVSP